MKRKALRNRLLWGVALICIVFVGDRCISAVLDRVFMSSQFRISAAFAGRLDADILVIGNSRGVHSFYVPALTEATQSTAANLSFNGLPARVLPALVAGFLEHQEPPKTLLIEVSCVGSQSSQQIANLQDYSPLWAHSLPLRRLLKKDCPTFSTMASISHLLRYNSDLVWRSLSFMRRSDQSWSMASSVSDGFLEQLPGRVEFELEKNETDAAALREAIEIAEQRGVRTILVLAPYLPEYRRSLEGVDGWVQWLEDAAGSEIHDYSAALEANELFADRLHSNRRGSTEFVADLVRELKLSP